jgi:quercetin dioxygenase-like cupin family protein
MNPYKEKYEDSYIIREFDSDVDSHELVWHRDKKDRIVEVISGEGWRFQMDNKLPIILKEGDVIEIPKETYHRIGRGTTNLIIKIKE